MTHVFSGYSFATNFRCVWLLSLDLHTIDFECHVKSEFSIFQSNRLWICGESKKLR